MRDPFSPNTNHQLIREAQIAFVVIGALLCVLVYVAFHRVSGKKMHFRQIAQSAPTAEHIDDTRHIAQAMPDKQPQTIDAAVDVIRRAFNSGESNGSSIATEPAGFSTSFASPKRQVETIKPLPLDKSVVAATIPVSPVPVSPIAQATFAEPVEAYSAASGKSPKPKSFLAMPTNTRAELSPSPDQKALPEIRSSFGAGSVRELPAFGEPKPGKAEVFVPEEFKPQSLKPQSLKPVVEPQAFTLQPIADKTLSLKTFTPKPIVPKKNVPKPIGAPKITPRPTEAIQSPVVQTETKSGLRSKSAATLKQEISKAASKAIPISRNEYKTQSDDSLWSIATTQYGDGRFFRALHEHNRDRVRSAEQLSANMILEIPPVGQLLKLYPDLCPSDKRNPSGAASVAARDQPDYGAYESRMEDRYHVTQNGDTLFGIARQRLGQASRYLEIIELNQFRISEDVNHLTPLPTGLRLLLPE